jgi:hypothetical protein
VSKGPWTRRQTLTVWAIPAAGATALVGLAMAFDAADRDGARTATYVAAGVVVPLLTAVAMRVVGEDLGTALIVGPILTGLFGGMAGCAAAFALDVAGADAAAGAIVGVVLSWLAVLLVVMLTGAAIDVARNGIEDTYGPRRLGTLTKRERSPTTKPSAHPQTPLAHQRERSTRPGDSHTRRRRTPRPTAWAFVLILGGGARRLLKHRRGRRVATSASLAHATLARARWHALA